ncbi:MAG: hypothetical protein ATN34_05165 [Epulopiscium sp. Nele67-Bin002]|nr:MAG: hypothetical protein ATN34_05165 [Epulopiscium sp. Nele67-Bin002]
MKNKKTLILMAIVLGLFIYEPQLVRVVVTVAIIIAIARSLSKRVKKYKNFSIDMATIDTMDGYEFEHVVCKLFEKQHYKSYVTKASGDFGADVIAQKKGEKVVVQVKRYSKNVGIRAVQEVHAAKSYYHGTKAVVVTNSHFTVNAKKLAHSCNVQLVDREQLIRWLQS